MNVFLSIIGLAISIFGVFKLIKSFKLTKNGIKMSGEIIEVRKKVDNSTDSEGFSSSTNMYYPVYKYSYEGKEYTKESSFGVSNSRKYKIGGSINIVISKDKPEDAELRGVLNLWIIPIIIFLVGIMLIILGFKPA